MDNNRWIIIDKVRALIRPEDDTEELRAFIADLPGSLSSARILQAGRHITSCTTLPKSGKEIVIKQFGRQGPIKDLYDRMNGSKAFRTYAAAMFMTENAIATVPPVACVEEWHGGRLLRSYFISYYLRGTICFKDKLAEIWRNDGEGIDRLLELVARGIRALHDAGCTHGDLGNQNIELVQDDMGTWFNGIAFLDLNRSRFGKELNVTDRARDLARISLPYGLYDDFFRHYWNDAVPSNFTDAYRHERCLFRLHGKTRKFRHPFRELKYKRHPESAPAQAGYPIPVTAASVMPEGKYTDSRALPLTREQVQSLPKGEKVYFFAK